MTSTERGLRAVREWYEGLPQQKGGFPPRGAIGCAICVLDRLKSEFTLDPKDHETGNQGQVAFASKERLRGVLSTFGIEREYVGDAVRTNRANLGHVRELLEQIDKASIADVGEDDRREALHAMQGFLVDRISDYFARKRIEFDFEAATPPRVIIADILTNAASRGQDGYVAQHLVGAKLAARFPNLTIQNFPVSAKDEGIGRSGDIHVGNTLFHVTVAPADAVLRKCEANLKAGFSVFLLVTDAKLDAARQLADVQGIAERISVESLESFVGQNVAEQSEFSRPQFVTELGRLLHIYNQRVKEAETDRSLMIEIPASLADS